MHSRTQNLQANMYIDLIFDGFTELRGDRKSGDGSLIVGGLARLLGQKIVVIVYGSIKSAEGLEISSPAGYRKASRLMHLAESFGKPVVIFIDIPNTPSLSETERQQMNEALARNLEEASRLPIPVIAVIIGEADIAAVGMSAADRAIMLEKAIFPVPSIDKGSVDDTKTSAFYARDLLDLGVIHRIVPMATDGDAGSVVGKLREVMLEEIRKLEDMNPDVRLQQRLDRLQYLFLNFGSQ